MSGLRCFVACCLAAACTSPPAPRAPLELAPFLALRPSHFPGAAAVLDGFAAADDDPSMRVGDAALLGIEVHRDGASERHLVLLEVVGLGWEPPQEVLVNGVRQPDGAGVLVRPSRSFTVTATETGPTGATPQPVTRTHRIFPVSMRLQRLDPAGRPQRTSDVTLYEEPLATGWWAMAAPDATPRDRDMAFALTMSLQELSGRDAVLQELLFRVVDTPSLWSVATNFGVNVVLRWDDGGQRPGPVAIDLVPAAGDEVRSSMLDLVVNGNCACWVTMLVAKPAGGTRACGGLVGAIAQHPDDPKRLAVVRLLGTRRGAKGTATKPT